MLASLNGYSTCSLTEFSILSCHRVLLFFLTKVVSTDMGRMRTHVVQQIRLRVPLLVNVLLIFADISICTSLFISDVDRRREKLSVEYNICRRTRGIHIIFTGNISPFCVIYVGTCHSSVTDLMSD